jgi:hypothetical protein
MFPKNVKIIEYCRGMYVTGVLKLLSLIFTKVENCVLTT